MKLLTLICIAQRLPPGADSSLSSIDCYVAVYLPGRFFHLLNIQHPDLICHSLFLTGMPVVFPSWTWSVWVHLNVNIYIWGGGVLLFADLLFFFFGQRTVKWLICYLIVLYSHCQGLWSWIRVLESSTGRSSTSHIYWSSCATPGWTGRGWPCFTVCSHVAKTHDDWKPRWEYSLSLEICKWTALDVYV